MYAAVARLGADIGMLRVLGFSRAGILTSLLVESLLRSAIGGVLGCLPLNTTRIGSFITFSEISFTLRITPLVMTAGLGFGILMGLIGGFFPARPPPGKRSRPHFAPPEVNPRRKCGAGAIVRWEAAPQWETIDWLP
jgi:hypothetical protein